MTSGKNVQEIETTTKQEARAKLRETFLRTLHELNGENCSILTFEKSVLQATFAGWSLENHEIIVRDLQTPSHAKLDYALLRTPDILAIQFDKPLESPSNF